MEFRNNLLRYLYLFDCAIIRTIFILQLFRQTSCTPGKLLKSELTANQTHLSTKIREKNIKKPGRKKKGKGKIQGWEMVKKQSFYRGDMKNGEPVFTVPPFTTKHVFTCNKYVTYL